MRLRSCTMLLLATTVACHAENPMSDASADGGDASLDASAPDAPRDATPYVNPDGGALAFPQAVFRATHNSYSGDVDGMKGSIATQLDRGVRFIELDLHDGAYGTLHDFGIGHDSIGAAVDHDGGNPASNALGDWLTLIAAWSDQHPTHAPMTVMFDLKDDLTGVVSYAAGDLAALNDRFATVFGTQLLAARDLGDAWPTVDALRGRVMVVLSGTQASRALYRRDRGAHPAVAMDATGRVVEVHEGASGALWYWTGTMAADGSVHWLRRGRLDAGRAPAVALRDDGRVVEADEATDGSGMLRTHVAQLGADGSIAWSAATPFATGHAPSVRFGTADSVREVHASAGGNEAWDGALDATTGALTWTAHAGTSDPRFVTDAADAGAMHVQVATGADGPTPADTLRYSTGTVTGGRVRYEQLAFVEYQDGDAAEMTDGAWYYAAPAADVAFIRAARSAGRITRGWDFDTQLYRTDPLANYPASNTPYASWYEAMVDAAGVVE